MPAATRATTSDRVRARPLIRTNSKSQSKANPRDRSTPRCTSYGAASSDSTILASKVSLGPTSQVLGIIPCTHITTETTNTAAGTTPNGPTASRWVRIIPVAVTLKPVKPRSRVSNESPEPNMRRICSVASWMRIGPFGLAGVACMTCAAAGCLSESKPRSQRPTPAVKLPSLSLVLQKTLGPLVPARSSYSLTKGPTSPSLSGRGSAMLRGRRRRAPTCVGRVFS